MLYFNIIISDKIKEGLFLREIILNSKGREAVTV